MEKRLLLAFILSFAILYVWSALFPAPNPTTIKTETTQTIDNKDVGKQPPPVKKVKAEAPPPPSFPEQFYTLENQTVRVLFTSIGGAIKEIYLKEYAASLPVTNIVDSPKLVDYSFNVTDKTPNSITFTAQINDSEVNKKFILKEKDYLLNVQIDIDGNLGMSKLDISTITGFAIDADRMDKKLKQSRDLGLIDYAYKINDTITRQGSIFKYSNAKEQFEINHKETNVVKTGPIDWIGFRNKYYTIILRLDKKFNNLNILNDDNNKLFINISTAKTNINSIQFKLFYGPQILDLLDQYELAETMKFSRFGLLDGICKLIYKVLNIIHKIIPNWGLCILILGTLIYGLTFPLTLKSMSSMKKIQALQPKIAKLREQYKNNPQRLSKEQMELFKEHKVNPMGGCLPMLLQMPLFIGFYQVLWRSVMFRGAKFLWIKDLSEPDRLIVLNSELPLIGNEFNILPFLMGIVMFFQQKFSSRNMAVSDPAQAQQQKMMALLLPFMMVFIFYKASSGLTLYFTYFYLLTTFTQWKLSQKA